MRSQTCDTTTEKWTKKTGDSFKLSFVHLPGLKAGKSSGRIRLSLSISGPKKSEVI